MNESWWLALIVLMPFAPDGLFYLLQWWFHMWDVNRRRTFVRIFSIGCTSAALPALLAFHIAPLLRAQPPEHCPDINGVLNLVKNVNVDQWKIYVAACLVALQSWVMVCLQILIQKTNNVPVSWILWTAMVLESGIWGFTITDVILSIRCTMGIHDDIHTIMIFAHAYCSAVSTCFDLLNEIWGRETAQIIAMEFKLKIKKRQVESLRNEVKRLNGDICLRNNQIYDLSRDVGGLQDHLAEKNKKAQKLEADVGRLNTELLLKNVEIANLSGDVGALEVRLAKKNDKVKKLEEEVGRLNTEENDKIVNLSRDVCTLEDCLAVKNKEAKLLEDDNTELRGRLIRMITENDDLRSKVTELEGCLLKRNEEAESLKSEVSVLHMELDAARQQGIAREAEVNILQEKLNTSVRQVKDVGMQVEEEGPLKVSKREAKDFEGELDEMRLQEKEAYGAEG